ncbi:hypothetical protein [Amycolatopsis suaedae]|uniref:Uncharacterized protein n=1 Tax=Amycolatopsis suaedae TaxID=2510978 RepID=A0A4Q7IYM2_9PSEU|nr:hypothetical protein [Amycolatopsis suaedae]RZQ59538.1 hypothetical protein EWH70_33660 [Amycolatopsis suaedae]
MTVEALTDITDGTPSNKAPLAKYETSQFYVSPASDPDLTQTGRKEHDHAATPRIGSPTRAA